MSDTNPFHVLIVVTFIILIAATAFGYVAPSLGFDTKDVNAAPPFPNFHFNTKGNQTAFALGGWAFSETHPVTLQINSLINVGYSSFSPHKRINIVQIGINTPLLHATYDYFRIQRLGTEVIIPWWFDEPITDLNGTDLGTHLNVQTIVNDFNSTSGYSTFIVDDGNTQYQAYASFSPLPGFPDMQTSWNQGNGFKVWIYGNAYANPTWIDQLINYLSFGASVIGFMLSYALWIGQMSGLMVTFLTGGSIPSSVGGVIIIIVGVVFVGSLLMFIRGNSGGK